MQGDKERFGNAGVDGTKTRAASAERWTGRWTADAAATLKTLVHYAITTALRKHLTDREALFLAAGKRRHCAHVWSAAFATKTGIYAAFMRPLTSTGGPWSLQFGKGHTPENRRCYPRR